MNITIKSTNISLTLAIKEYVEKKVLSLEKFIHDEPENIRAEIEVGKISNHHKSGDIFRAEAHLLFKGGKGKIYAVAEKDDLYASIDEMRDKVEQECVSQKGKKETLAKRAGAKAKKILHA